jgi:hypothetical protein
MFPRPTGWRRIATAATAAVPLGALYVFATQLHGHYPCRTAALAPPATWPLALWGG